MDEIEFQFQISTKTGELMVIAHDQNAACIFCDDKKCETSEDVMAKFRCLIPCG